MGYGYGTGFVKATSDIPLINLRLPLTNLSNGAYANFKVMGTNVNYQVPPNKTGLIALYRALRIDVNMINNIMLGYADDASGTNFVPLVSHSDMGITSYPAEVYWVFRIPGGKYIGLKNSIGANDSGEAAIVVLFEV